MKRAVRSFVRIGGWLLSITAVFFFARLVFAQGLALPEHSPWQLGGIIVAGAFMYSLMVMLLALIWAYLAIPQKTVHLQRRLLCSTYLKSQFAKYIPGNVFQYAARHALGRQLGVEHGWLASAALLEAFLLMCAACMIVIAWGQDIAGSLVPSLPTVSPLWALLVFPLVVAIARLPRPRILKWFPNYHSGVLLCALGAYLIFFTAFGALFHFTLTWSVDFPPGFLRALTCSSLAWLVGFAVPGAPAGAGMREAALALATGSFSPSAEVLTAILLFRAVTLIGDFLAFLAGLAISVRR